MSSERLSPAPKTIQRIPVIIISGFLGSGKTTLLNRLLSHAPKSAVIINEFGATGIDQQILREHKVPLSTLVGGCLCCQVRGSLAPILKNLRMAWDADNHYFERVIIETSGVANPEPILDILLKDRWLSARFSLQAAITTVSAIMDARNFERFPEVTAQIAFADSVVLTQTDLADAWQQKQIQTKLGQLAPTATHLIAMQGEIDPDAIFNTTKKLRRQRGDDLVVTSEHELNTITVQLTAPISSQRLHTVLTYLTLHYSAQLVRFKGLVYTTEQNQPLMVHGVAGKLYPPSYLPHRPSDDGIGRLVLIYTGEIPGFAESILKHWFMG
jgi:G3E family GTPase